MSDLSDFSVRLGETLHTICDIFNISCLAGGYGEECSSVADGLFGRRGSFSERENRHPQLHRGHQALGRLPVGGWQDHRENLTLLRLKTRPLSALSFPEIVPTLLIKNMK